MPRNLTNVDQAAIATLKATVETAKQGVSDAQAALVVAKKALNDASKNYQDYMERAHKT